MKFKRKPCRLLIKTLVKLVNQKKHEWTIKQCQLDRYNHCKQWWLKWIALLNFSFAVPGPGSSSRCLTSDVCSSQRKVSNLFLNYHQDGFFSEVNVKSSLDKTKDSKNWIHYIYNIHFFVNLYRPADPLEFIANYLLKEAKTRTTQNSETANQALPSACAWHSFDNLTSTLDSINLWKLHFISALDR